MALELEKLLFAACENGQLEVVKDLVNSRNIDVECQDEDGDTPFHVACYYGHIEIARFLAIDKECDTATRNNKGNIPLHLAAGNRHLEIVRFLMIEKKCDAESRNNSGRTPLHHACQGGHLHIVRYLIDEMHVNPLCRDDALGATPLHLAPRFGHTEIVRYLILEKKIDAESRDNNSNTPLHRAALYGHLDAVKVLVNECHCDTMCKGQYGRTPLHAACQNGHLNVTMYLIDERNVDASHRDMNNVTPLHMAAVYGHTEVVKYLVGVKMYDAAPRDIDGETPYDWACQHGHMDIALYLEGQGGGASGAQKPHPTVPDSPINTASAPTSPPQESDREPAKAEAKQPIWVVERETLEKALQEAEQRVRDLETNVKRLEAEAQESHQRTEEEQQKAQTAEHRAQKAEQRATELQAQVDSTENALQEANTRAHEAIQAVQSEVQELNQRMQEAKSQEESANRREKEAEQRAEDAQRRVQREQEQTFWAVEQGEITLTEETVGRGGWGVVKVAKFRGTRVAAKCLYSMIASDYNRRLFIREMNIAAKVRHPNLLQFIAATIREELIILTELMPTSLRAVLERGPISHQQTVSISLDVVRALNYLHLMRPHPIIHRDLSSGNVLLEPGPNNSWRAKVSDYGSANFLQQLRTAGPGNPNYAAPEALNPNQQSPKMDIFSLGVLFVEMCTDSFPDADSREELIRSINNPEMVRLIRECTDKERDGRPSAAEIMTRLSEL